MGCKVHVLWYGGLMSTWGTTPPTPVQQAILNLATEAHNLILREVGSHKRLAVDKGFSEDAAEAMSVTLHSMLVATAYDFLQLPTEGTPHDQDQGHEVPTVR